MMPLSVTKSLIIIPNSISYAGLSEEKEELLDLCDAERVDRITCLEEITRMNNKIIEQRAILDANTELVHNNISVFMIPSLF